MPDADSDDPRIWYASHRASLPGIVEAVVFNVLVLTALTGGLLIGVVDAQLLIDPGLNYRIEGTGNWAVAVLGPPLLGADYVFCLLIAFRIRRLRKGLGRPPYGKGRLMVVGAMLLIVVLLVGATIVYHTKVYPYRPHPAKRLTSGVAPIRTVFMDLQTVQWCAASASGPRWARTASLSRSPSRLPAYGAVDGDPG